jgi:hypothetical protein
MAFKNYEELMRMARSDPKRATSLVSKAQSSNTPVVSENNTGYKNSRMAAMRRRMTTRQAIKSDQEGTEELVNNRKKLNY